MLYAKWLPHAVPTPVFGHRFETRQGYKREDNLSELRLEICRCDAGVATMEIAGQPIEMQAGDLIVWPPHTHLRTDTSPYHVHTTVAFTAQECELLDEEQARAFVMAHGGIARNSSVDYFMLPLHLPGASSAACELLGRTMAAVRSGDATSRMRSSGLFLLVCEEITSHVVRQLAAPGATPVHVDHCRQVMEYVAAHYHERVSVELLAQTVGLTPNYLCTLFKQTVGVSPVQYITQYRIGVAKELLLSTALPVSEVAAAVGFDDAAYFCRVFRRSEKLPPTVWRASR